MGNRQAALRRASARSRRAIARDDPSRLRRRRWALATATGARAALHRERDEHAAAVRARGRPYVKDGIQRLRRRRRRRRGESGRPGTKAAAHYTSTVARRERSTLRLRLNDMAPELRRRRSRGVRRASSASAREADEFYATVIPDSLSRRCANVHAPGARRPALVEAVLPLRREGLARGRPGQPAAAARARTAAATHEWTHLYNADVISMPDKWEYPWYAAWDLAFHCVPLALVDSEFAKEQLVLLLREWYMHPNGQLPAYEWAFGDVNPPVHAWAAWRVYKIEKKRRGVGDRQFPRARLPQAAAELHLVGQPQGRRGHERLPGRLPRPRQHRRLRSQRAAADRRPPRAVRRHELDGDVSRSTCWRSRWSWRATTRLRGRRQQVLGALPLHRARDEDQHGDGRASSSGTRRTASSTTCCTCRTDARRSR